MVAVIAVRVPLRLSRQPQRHADTDQAQCGTRRGVGYTASGR